MTGSMLSVVYDMMGLESAVALSQLPMGYYEHYNYGRTGIVSDSFEVLREKVELLGRFQGILLKFHILKIQFLHEKIIWIFP